jgi:hypothetical protein
MKYGTTCKFCLNPITIDIDDDYAALGDPYKLLPMACCNRCADIRVERRQLEDKIKFVCKMRELDPKLAVQRREKDRATLERLLKKYSNLIARWHFKEGMCWDDAVLETIMETPKQWFDVLGKLWKMFRESVPAQKELV